MVQLPNFCFWVEIFPWYPLNMGNLFSDQLGPPDPLKIYGFAMLQ